MSRRKCSARVSRMPAADRRRDHLARAYGGEDRAALRGPVVTWATPPARWPYASVAVARPQTRLRGRAGGRVRAPAPPACGQEGSGAHRAGRSPRQPHAHRLARLCAAAPQVPRARELLALDLAQLARYIDWGPFFKTWEMAGPIRPCSTMPWWARRRAACSMTPADARAHHRRPWLTATRSWPSTRPMPNGDDIAVYADEARHARHSRGMACASRRASRLSTARRGPIARWPTSSRPPARPITWACSPSPPAWAWRRARHFARDHDDYGAIMLKALADRLAEAGAECCTLRVRRDLWGYATDDNWRPRRWWTKPIAASAPHRGIRPARSTASSATCSRCCRPSDRHAADRNPGDAAGLLVCGFYLAHPQAPISPSARSAGPAGRPGAAPQARQRHAGALAGAQSGVGADDQCPGPGPSTAAVPRRCRAVAGRRGRLCAGARGQ